LFPWQWLSPRRVSNDALGMESVAEQSASADCNLNLEGLTDDEAGDYFIEMALANYAAQVLRSKQRALKRLTKELGQQVVPIPQPE